jgi:TonB family protein
MIGLAIALATVTTETGAIVSDFQDGWGVIKAETFCSATREYEGSGSTKITLFSQPNREFIFNIANENWSVVPKVEYRVTLYLDGARWDAVMVGSKSEKPSISGKFGADFIEHFGIAHSLSARLNGRLVDNLSLDGSAKAARALLACPFTPSKPKPESVVDDPFLDVGLYPRPEKRVSVTADQYPSQSIRNHESGTASYVAHIDSDGRALDCKITESTGFPALDSQTCAIVKRYIQFDLGPSKQGGDYNGAIHWPLLD